MTALTMAGVDPMVPASPIPFAPSGFSGVAVSVWPTSIDGIDSVRAAVGARTSIGVPSLDVEGVCAGDDHGVDIAALVEHATIVLITPCAGKRRVDRPCDRVIHVTQGDDVLAA